MSLCCTKSCITFSTDDAFPDVQVTHRATNAAPYHQTCRLLNCLLITSWMLLSSLVWKLQSSCFQKHFKFGFKSDHDTVFASVQFKWGLTQRGCSLSGSWELQPAFIDGMVNCVHRQWFLEVVLSQCNDTMVPVCNVVPSKKDYKHPIVIFLAHSYWDLLNFLWTRDYEIINVFTFFIKEI